MNEQQRLELRVKNSIAVYGEMATIERIKNGDGVFKNYSSLQCYPAGVEIFLNTEKGGVMVGKKK